MGLCPVTTLFRSWLRRSVTLQSRILDTSQPHSGHPVCIMCLGVSGSLRGISQSHTFHLAPFLAFHSRKAGFPHFGHCSTSFWTPCLHNLFGSTGRSEKTGMYFPVSYFPLGPFSRFPLPRSGRPSFWTPVNLILDSHCAEALSKQGGFTQTAHEPVSAKLAYLNIHSEELECR